MKRPKKPHWRCPKNTTPYLEIPGFIPDNRENAYQNHTVDHNFHTNCHKLGWLPRFSDKPELLHKPQSASTKCLTTSNPTMASGSKDVGIGQVTGCPKFIHMRSIINFPKPRFAGEKKLMVLKRNCIEIDIRIFSKIKSNWLHCNLSSFYFLDTKRTILNHLRKVLHLFYSPYLQLSLKVRPIVMF